MVGRHPPVCASTWARDTEGRRSLRFSGSRSVKAMLAVFPRPASASHRLQCALALAKNVAALSAAIPLRPSVETKQNAPPASTDAALCLKARRGRLGACSRLFFSARHADEDVPDVSHRIGRYSRRSVQRHERIAFPVHRARSGHQLDDHMARADHGGEGGRDLAREPLPIESASPRRIRARCLW